MPNGLVQGPPILEASDVQIRCLEKKYSAVNPMELALSGVYDAGKVPFDAYFRCVSSIVSGSKTSCTIPLPQDLR